MAGPQLTKFLAAGDYETYRTIVRHYNHDVANRISRITTECSIISRIIEKVPSTDVFTDPKFEPEGAPLAAEARALLNAITNSREYFYPPGDTETINQARWKPYNADAWDKMIEGYNQYLMTQLQPVLPLFERLKRLEEANAIRTDSKAAPMANSRHSISFSIGELEELLTPESWDSLLDEWLERVTQ